MSNAASFGDLNIFSKLTNILDKPILVMSGHRPGPLLWARSSNLCFVGWGVY